MELLRGRQPGADSKHAAQECHHVETRGYDETVAEQHWEEMFYLKTQLNKSSHIFISSVTPSLVF